MQTNMRSGLRPSSSCKGMVNDQLETFMKVEQRTVLGTKPRIHRVVSKSDSDHVLATTAHRALGLTPVGPICHSNLSLGHHPILRVRVLIWVIMVSIVTKMQY